MWDHVRAALRDPMSQGAGPIQMVAVEPFYDEDDLPFEFGEGSAALHIYPKPGFPKEALAGSEEERLLIVDDPEEGWVVPEDIVADWMARNVSCPALDDIMLAHPLYEYLTKPDEHGHSRSGRGELVQWAPGMPNLASLYAPEFLPGDDEAPPINTDRAAYADAVVDLAQTLDASFTLEELEIGVRWRGSHLDDVEVARLRASEAA